MKVGIGTMLAAVMLGAVGAQALDVTSDGTHYTVTAPGLWEMKIRAANGCIWSFKDLTDAGNGAGGHFNYMGEDAYDFARSLLEVQGREDAGVGHGTSLPSNGSLGFSATGTDLASFTMTYDETFNGNSGTYLYGGTYADGTASVTNGNVLSQVIITINDPTPAGTVLDYYIKNMGQRPTGENLSAKYFLALDCGVRSYLADGRDQVGDYASAGEGMNITRTIAQDSDWAIATVDVSALNQAADHGLTAGRSFTLARTSQTAGFTVNGKAKLSYNAGNTWATFVPATAPTGQDNGAFWWANIDGMQLQDAGRYSPTVSGDVVKESAGTLTIDIASPEPSGGLIIDYPRTVTRPGRDGKR